ncbi:MAG: LysM peptidoglycan-binding domain-containing protein [Bacteroidetes bacterium]|nr:LysM peptidoglycan-binding domain-containing protein [Bacteroidota bacterium]
MYKNPNANITNIVKAPTAEAIPTATNAYAPTTIAGADAGINATEVVDFNNLKAVKVNRGDTWYKIAREQELELHDLLRYNDAASNEILKPGEMVYLQQKNKHAQANSHVVLKGETFRSISQLHGIRLKRLFKLNDMTASSKINVGAILKLR